MRPVFLERAGLILDTGASTPLEVPIAVLTDAEYAAWPSKTEQASQPSAIWYNRAWSAGLGLVHPLPIPNVGTTQLVLYAPGVAVAQFADLDTTDYTFPPGYARALRKNLALELAPSYPGAVVSNLLIQQASDSKRYVKRANVRSATKRSDPALTRRGGVWDMNTGSFR